MKILAIEGALGEFSAALYDTGGDSRTETLSAGKALEDGLAAVARIAGAFSTRPNDLDMLAVGAGPGSFTGARIAISYAKALALGWSLPIVSISSFDILEMGAQAQDRDALTIVRGHRDVISARLRVDGEERRASGTAASVAGRLAEFLNPKIVLIGDASEDVLAAFGERARTVPILSQTILPAALALAMAAAQREPAHSVHELRPDYGDVPAVRETP